MSWNALLSLLGIIGLIGILAALYHRMYMVEGMEEMPGLTTSELQAAAPRTRYDSASASDSAPEERRQVLRKRAKSIGIGSTCAPNMSIRKDSPLIEGQRAQYGIQSNKSACKMTRDMSFNLK